MNNEEIDKYLTYLKENNIYYGQKLKNIHVNNYEFTDINILTKQDIRNNSDEIISKGYSKETLNREQTNGTTEKKPLILYKSTKERIQLDMQLWKSRFKLSKTAPLRCNVYYYDADILYNERKSYKYGNRLVIYSQMNKNSVEKYLDDLRYFKEKGITWLIGPISVMYKLARVSEYYDFKVDFEYIEFTSEYPTTFYREYIEKQFNCKTCSQYSCHELWGIAFTDENNKLKIYSDTIVEESKEHNSLRGLGNAIVTKLTLKSMPFLRYHITDLIKIERDEIKNYGFRSKDKVSLDRKDIPWYFFDNIFYQLYKEGRIPIDLLPLENYQIIYDKNDSIININTNNIPKVVVDIVKEVLNLRIKREYGEGIRVEVNKVEKFDRDNLTGKMRAILPTSVLNNEIW